MPRTLRARRRLAALARAALPDRVHRVQAHLLRHRARLSVVAVPAVAAVRGPVRGVHAHRAARHAVPHYPVLLLFNIVLFGFFQEATSTAVGSVVAQEAIVRKTQFPRLVIPLAVVLTSWLQPRAEPDRGVHLHPRLRRRPDVDVAAAAGAAAVAVRPDDCDLDDRCPRCTRDSATWGSSGRCSSTALFYATPVLYPLDKVSGTLATVIS